MLWVPTHSLEFEPENASFVFLLKPGWRNNERALIFRWGCRYESILTTHVCAYKHEKPAFPFDSSDMGVLVQSCNKDYCVLSLTGGAIIQRASQRISTVAYRQYRQSQGHCLSRMPHKLGSKNNVL